MTTGGSPLRDFFGQAGAGADLTVWVQTSAGTASFAASGVRSAGSQLCELQRAGVRPRRPDRHRHGRPAPAGPHQARALYTQATGAPAITGTAQVGQILTAGTGDISDAEGLDNVAYTYQWLADDTQITDATASTHILTPAEEGKKIKVRVSFSDDEGNEEQLTSTETAAVAAAPNTPATGDPTITGTVQVGETLTASTSAISDAEGLDNVAYTYQWLADDTEIANATASTYTLTPAEEGKAIRVRVSFNDDEGNGEERTSAATAAVTAAPATNTAATGDPTITGTVQVGETLTAGTSAISDAEGLDNVAHSYQWLADDTDIAGATAITYTLTADEEGKAIRVKVSFNDDEGNEEQLTSTETAAVAAANTEATGAPTITGTVQVGQTLTAGTSGISDAEGLTNVAYTYQWSADDTQITGATVSAYTLTTAEEGKAIKVRVSFNDDDGNAEELHQRRDGCRHDNSRAGTVAHSRADADTGTLPAWRGDPPHAHQPRAGTAGRRMDSPPSRPRRRLPGLMGQTGPGLALLAEPRQERPSHHDHAHHQRPGPRRRLQGTGPRPPRAEHLQPMERTLERGPTHRVRAARGRSRNSHRTRPHPRIRNPGPHLERPGRRDRHRTPHPPRTRRRQPDRPGGQHRQRRQELHRQFGPGGPDLPLRRGGHQPERGQRSLPHRQRHLPRRTLQPPGRRVRRERIAQLDRTRCCNRHRVPGPERRQRRRSQRPGR